MPDESGWWWLSFVDMDKPEGSRFLGVCIVGPVLEFTHAIPLSHACGCNPGGAVKGFKINPAHIERLPETFTHRLLTRDECEQADVMLAGLWN